MTNNPVKDAEEHSIDNRRAAGECDICHRTLYAGNSLYDGDTFYPINSLVVCDDCIRDYLNEIRRECIC